MDPGPGATGSGLLVEPGREGLEDGPGPGVEPAAATQVGDHHRQVGERLEHLSNEAADVGQVAAVVLGVEVDEQDQAVGTGQLGIPPQRRQVAGVAEVGTGAGQVELDPGTLQLGAAALHL